VLFRFGGDANKNSLAFASQKTPPNKPQQQQKSVVEKKLLKILLYQPKS